MVYEGEKKRSEGIKKEQNEIRKINGGETIIYKRKKKPQNQLCGKPMQISDTISSIYD